MIYTILTIIYIAFAVIVAAAVVWNMFTTDKVYEKITGAVMLILLILRIFLIK